MKIFAVLITVIVVLWCIAKFAVPFLTQRVSSDPEYKQAVSEYERKRNLEEATLEAAPWIGVTGLSEAIERELPRYLRREFGEFLEDGGLKASDLVYLGKFLEPPHQVHYWRIPSSNNEPIFAYVMLDENGDVLALNWGNEEPKGVVTSL
ncbi:MAG: hypothetical protein LBE75_02275 [Burkholderiales bacterium]|nr:hypothetical protein [Burkholderiales bacterium]